MRPRDAIGVALLAGTADQRCAAQVVINEVLPNPDGSPNEEWVELFNPSSTAQDVAGWTVCDNGGPSASGAVTLASGATVPAGGWLVVVVRSSDGYLNNGGDSVVLHNSSGATIDSVSWSAAAPGDLTLARRPDGAAWWAGGSGSYTWAAPTRGTSNGAPPASGTGLAGGAPAGGVSNCSAPGVRCLLITNIAQHSQ